jgi:hypothetical protein
MVIEIELPKGFQIKFLMGRGVGRRKRANKMMSLLVL